MERRLREEVKVWREGLVQLIIVRELSGKEREGGREGERKGEREGGGKKMGEGKGEEGEKEGDAKVEHAPVIAFPSVQGLL